MAPPKGTTPKTPKLTPRRTMTPKSSAKKRKEVEQKPKKEIALFSSEEDDKSADDDIKEADKSFAPPSPHSSRGRRSSGSSGKGRLVDLSMYGEDELQRDRDEVFALHTSCDSGKSVKDSKLKELPKESQKENQLDKSVIEAEISQISKDLDEFEDFELTIEYKKVERVKDKNEKKSAKDNYLDNKDENLFDVESESKDDRGDASSLDVNFSRTTNRTGVSTPKSAKTSSEFDSIYSPSAPLSAIGNSTFGDWSDISVLDSSKSASNRRGSKVETPRSSLKRSLPLSTSTPISALRPPKQRRK
ncbi:unnamed protein product, partial [Mesorhabditis belari]|uniref:Uncharacterized protein n=1 Tax=Mesorhabditis belari TaxID=2138241 RepID=A0AAF3EQ54_9BILA